MVGDEDVADRCAEGVAEDIVENSAFIPVDSGLYCSNGNSNPLLPNRNGVLIADWRVGHLPVSIPTRFEASS